MTRNPEKTRNRLLESAFEEIHAHGFQGMRVDEVLRKAELQKGAFYHHFSSKLELSYAVLEERVTPLLAQMWLEPIKDTTDPIKEFPKFLQNLTQNVPQCIRDHGCPLNNLAQEMSSQDKGFQERIAVVFNRWIDGYTELFKKAQESGKVTNDVDAEEIARFLVAILEGTLSVSKGEQSPLQWQACHSQLQVYLQGLAVKA